MSEEVFSGNPFDEWIAGASISKRSVPVYGKPGLYARWQELERERVAAEKAKVDDSLGDSSLAAIDDQLQALYDEWMASKSTWTVRPISDAARAAIEESVGAQPVEPKSPPVGASDADKATFARKFKAYRTLDDAYSEKVNFHVLAAATERIEFADGRVADGVTVEQLEALRDRLGEVQLLRLINETTLATLEEPQISAPFSRANSENAAT